MIAALVLTSAAFGAMAGFAAGAVFWMLKLGSAADDAARADLPLDQRVRESEGRQ